MSKSLAPDKIQFILVDDDDDVTAAVLGFKFDPHQPRDKDGQWTDGPLGGVNVDLPSIPKQALPGGLSGGTGKKATPAIIYKKHADGTIVATSGDGKHRMRWAADRKKFAVDENKDGEWQESELLNKTSAYNDLKNQDKWFEFGQTSTKSEIPKPPSEPEHAAAVVEPTVETSALKLPHGTIANPRFDTTKTDAYYDDLMRDLTPPDTKRPAYVNPDLAKMLPIEEVNLADLIHTQSWLRPVKLGPTADTLANDPVIVYRAPTGELYLANGHHRVTQALANGDKSIPVRMYDNDHTIPANIFSPPVDAKIYNNDVTDVSNSSSAQATVHLTGDAAMDIVPKGLFKKDTLNAKQIKGIRAYETSEFRTVNEYLRSGKLIDPEATGNTGYVSRIVDAMDSAHSESVLDQAIQVWRGMYTSRQLFQDSFDGDLTGFSWKELGYGSTTAKESVAHDFMVLTSENPKYKGQNVKIRVNIPAGVKAVQISSSTEGSPTNGAQAEINLQRGLTWRITKDHGWHPDGYRLLDAEVTP
jgi:hypothetical protein